MCLLALLKVEEEHKNGTYQLLHPQRESPNRPCSPRRYFRIIKWISLTYIVGAFQTVAFVLVPRASPLGEISQFPTALVFNSRHFGGSSLRCRSQWLGYLGWGMNPLLLREKLQICEIPPDCGSPSWAWGFWRDFVSASPTHLHVALLLFVVKELFS